MRRVRTHHSTLYSFHLILIYDIAELRKHLKKLRLTPTSLIQFTTQSTHQSLSVDNYLTQLIRQGYLDREQISGKGNGTKKRARGVTSTQARGGEDDTEDWEWRWGPRAMTEVGEVGVAKFIAEFMAQRMPLEAEDAEGDAKKVQIEKRVDALMGGIQKAAGESELVRIKS